MTTDPRYVTTHRAWQQIWHHANIERELEAIRSARSLETIRAYEPYLPKDDLILEAGSGLSAVVITLRRRGYNVVGLDYAANALHMSRHYDESLTLTEGDVHRLPFADNALGAYLSFGVLEHFEHGMEPALAEAHRILKPNGVLVLTIPYPNVVHRVVALRRMLSGQSQLTDEDFYESTYTREALTQTVSRVGFRVMMAKPTSHAFTLWGLGGVFRGRGYYETSRLAEAGGQVIREVFPWAFNFMTLVIARK